MPRRQPATKLSSSRVVSKKRRVKDRREIHYPGGCKEVQVRTIEESERFEHKVSAHLYSWTLECVNESKAEFEAPDPLIPYSTRAASLNRLWNTPMVNICRTKDPATAVSTLRTALNCLSLNIYRVQLPRWDYAKTALQIFKGPYMASWQSGLENVKKNFTELLPFFEDYLKIVKKTIRRLIKRYDTPVKPEDFHAYRVDCDQRLRYVQEQSPRRLTSAQIKEALGGNPLPAQVQERHALLKETLPEVMNGPFCGLTAAHIDTLQAPTNMRSYEQHLKVMERLITGAQTHPEIEGAFLSMYLHYQNVAHGCPVRDIRLVELLDITSGTKPECLSTPFKKCFKTFFKCRIDTDYIKWAKVRVAVAKEHYTIELPLSFMKYQWPDCTFNTAFETKRIQHFVKQPDPNMFVTKLHENRIVPNYLFLDPSLKALDDERIENGRQAALEREAVEAKTATNSS